ncbi:EAL domain-containing protein [Cohnella sp. CFH 77786]|uniref:bifunctional diguanylate cyclase/phosphodiesterase n=1 Tax=Cohnella sp. CFH 77786 TaxID=2662265 RepID=UPI001C608901|nr:EAL domain-containing protein [Cohnella sp. CFH 77786]MBW5448283.1 EAL domain-containing protein [Cohnella sp. CFH 77786]
MKIMLYVGVTTFCLLTILYVIFRSAIIGNYEMMENNDTQQGMKRILYSYFDEYRNLGAITINYAGWDDTYRFVMRHPVPGEDDPYLAVNYTDSLFESSRLNVALLLNNRNEVYFAKAYDYASHKRLPYPGPFVDALLTRYSSLLPGANPASRKVGLILLKGRPIIVAAFPILTSNNEGPVHGTLVFARDVDAEFTRYLSEKADTELTIEPVSHPAALPGDTGKIRGPGHQDFPYWTRTEPNAIRGYALLPDIRGEPAIMLQYTMPRELSVQAQRDNRFYMAFFLVSGLLFYLLVNFVLQRFVFSRMNRVKSGMKTIQAEQDFSLRIPEIGNDEFTRLEKSFNRMMSSLEFAQQEIRYQNEHDSLTGLANRKAFFLKVKRLVYAGAVNRSQFAVLYIDLDHFKRVNDGMGHQAGDSLLQQAAVRLERCLGEGDFLYRLGGDEFCAVVPVRADSREIDDLAVKITNALAVPYDLDGRSINTSASVGICLFPDHGIDAEGLLLRADAAMLDVKENGKGHHRWFSADIERQRTRKWSIERLLKHALQKDELRLVFQPKWDLPSDRILGVEALLRWTNPELGAVSPCEFIPAAESTGLIHEIGEWVIRAACRQYLAWRTDEPGLSLVVAVNVSGIQLLEPDFVRRIGRIVEEENMDPRCLELEVTETFAIENFEEVSDVLVRLRSMGFTISIDDFGAGYSSMKYICELPVQCMKIDKALVECLSEDVRHQIVVAKLIEMAHRLELAVVAEGVETREQLDFLRSYGCDQVQGYFIGRPMPADQVLGVKIP